MSSASVRLDDLPSCISDSDTVKVWQRYLNSIGILSSASGKFDEATEAASEAYGRKIYKSGDDVFVMSFEQPYSSHYREVNGANVPYTIQSYVAKLAFGFFVLTGDNLEITSGTRDADDQAKHMYKKVRHGRSALNIYKRQDLAEAVWAAYKAADKAGDDERAEVSAISAVIHEQMRHGEYISAHLTGRAIDIRNRSMNSCEKDCFRAVFKVVVDSHGILIEHEPGGEPHFHVQLD